MTRGKPYESRLAVLRPLFPKSSEIPKIAATGIRLFFFAERRPPPPAARTLLQKVYSSAAHGAQAREGKSAESEAIHSRESGD